MHMFWGMAPCSCFFGYLWPHISVQWALLLMATSLELLCWWVTVPTLKTEQKLQLNNYFPVGKASLWFQILLYLFRRVLTLHPSQRGWKPTTRRTCHTGRGAKDHLFLWSIGSQALQNLQNHLHGRKNRGVSFKTIWTLAKMGHLLRNESQFAGLKTTT